ncbi:MAG: HPr family phosphocarrier protein [Treponema sp.]|nr:HPr family phosphocarrier protein [Spirochaetia bacterium]MDD7014678.1 HPr family phosphocarrier protein [Spirochaetales bacterium]MDY4902472.1 HPr family phosphocarrier protein [Treponema sp.]
MVEKLLTVRNRAGIHARPAALIAQTANKFESEVILERDTTTVNAKSIMGVITMAAGYNTTLTLKTEGSDEKAAADAIFNLFESRFEEE